MAFEDLTSYNDLWNQFLFFSLVSSSSAFILSPFICLSSNDAQKTSARIHYKNRSNFIYNITDPHDGTTSLIPILFEQHMIIVDDWLKVLDKSFSKKTFFYLILSFPKGLSYFL